MKRQIVLFIMFYELSFLLHRSFMNAQESKGNNDLSFIVGSFADCVKEDDDDYIRPTQASHLCPFVLDAPRLVNRYVQSTKIIAAYTLSNNKELFERALAVKTHPEFEPYIARFVEEKGKPLLYDVRITFSQGERSRNMATGAVCDIITRNIYIDREYWNNLRDEFRELLIFHELGHCELNRGHAEHFSIMNEEVLRTIEHNSTFHKSQEFYDILYKELFSNFSSRKETHHPRHRTLQVNTVIDISIHIHRIFLGIDEF